MRKLLHSSFTLALLLICLLSFRSTWASDTRLNAVGGLNLVLQDESADFSPFIFGNPAGLVLLPSQSRFDASGAFFLMTPAFDQAAQVQGLGLLSNTGNNFSTSSLTQATNGALNYQGFILFPQDHWAFQASGDLLHATNQLDSFVNETSMDRDRGMVRTAVGLDPVVIGTEIDLTQTNKVLPSLFNGGPTGQGNASVITTNSGLLLDFPLDRDKTPARLRIGGVFGTQVQNSQETDTITVNSGGTPVTETVTFTVPSYMTFGPDLYLEKPGSFQSSLIARIGHSEVDNAVIPSVPSYPFETSDDLFVLGGTKIRFPLAGTLRQKLTLNTGGYFLVGNAQTKQTDTSGKTVQTTNASTFQTGIGIGLENEGDFTMGLQTALNTRSGSIAPNPGSSLSLGFLGYSISLGGEKWINPHWALRGGLNFEDDINNGDVTVMKIYYDVPPGMRIVATTLSAGLGLKEGLFRSDLTIWTGQPSVYDSPNPDAFATQAGIQGTLTLLFN